MVDKYIVRYHQLPTIFINLINQIKDRNFTHIFGVANGGLPISTHIKNHLDLIPILSFQDILLEDKMKILIVDDVADTGNTLKEIIDDLTNVYDFYNFEILTMFRKPQSIVMPHYYYKMVDDDVWIVFPWEPEK